MVSAGPESRPPLLLPGGWAGVRRILVDESTLQST